MPLAGGEEGCDCIREKPLWPVGCSGGWSETIPCMPAGSEEGLGLTSLPLVSEEVAAITQSSLLLIRLQAAGPRGQPVDSCVPSGPPWGMLYVRV